MLNDYRLRMQHMGGYDGEAKRKNSQKIMDASWMRDAATKPVYVKWVDRGLPEITDEDIPLYAKFNVKSYHNITGDEIAYLLQFRQEDIKANDNIRIGSYVQIKNEMGEPEWWMIVHSDDRLQFRQYSILKCLHVYRWVSVKDNQRIIHECLGVPRSQNSYNSGVWLDYKFQVVENQNVMILPSNDDANTIQYDTKFLISNEGRYPPIAWKISKIQPKINGDITYFTMTQEQFNPSTDNVELMIADYYQSAIEPTPEMPESTDVEFVYSGTATVKAGGSYKKFTLKHIPDYTDINTSITWSVEADKMDVSNIDMITDGNIIKVKCINDYSLIGNVFTIIASSDYGTKSIKVEVTSL